LRILGLGFGLALAFGGTVGVGILRLPGTVAAALGDPTLIMLAWLVGGVYALMGAVALSELAAMMPQAGGFRVYAQRAYGESAGFAIGWVDWLCTVVAAAYVSITVVQFVGLLWPPATIHPRAAAIAIFLAFTAIHWTGLRLGSSITSTASALIGLLFALLIAGCFLTEPVAAPATPFITSSDAAPMMSMAMAMAVVPAMRSVLTAYDGWYAPIYMAEENTDPARTLPRAIVGGTLLVMVLYLLFNLALLQVLAVPVLATSVLPAADAARVVWPQGGAELVTIISVLLLLSLLNNNLLMAPRVLYGLSRDGLLAQGAASVSESGAPRGALALSSAAVLVIVMSGSFEQIIALFAVLFLVLYVSAFAAVFVLRRREPELARPFNATGFPVTTAIVLAGSVVFLVLAAYEDPRSALIAAVFMAGCLPAYEWMARRRRMRMAAASA
jgi:APA family basic amino acid/polyamine antiporter